LFEKHSISKSAPLMIVTDEQVAKYHLRDVLARLEQGGFKPVYKIVPSGEKTKSLEMLQEIVGEALAAGLDRKSAIVALGGGVVGDLAGFVAASYMRGVRFIQIPTTILAHDSSVGGKVAVNHPKAKNIIGAFHQPVMVLYDTDTLRTLPDREIRAGLSEVIKHGLIWDRSFTEWLDAHSGDLLSLHSGALEHALYEGCKVKARVVSEDEREGGLRAILNFGHTIGHAVEAVGGYGELLHGEAISIGMVGAARLSVKRGSPPEVYTETKRILQKFGLPVRLPEHYRLDEIMSAMMHDKKFKEGKMVFILLKELGKVEIRDDISAAEVEEIVQQLKQEE